MLLVGLEGVLEATRYSVQRMVVQNARGGGGSKLP